MSLDCMSGFIFFFNDTATTEIYTLSLHDALPIYKEMRCWYRAGYHVYTYSKARVLSTTQFLPVYTDFMWQPEGRDRKSTRLNSSHANISYAVFCLKKKKTIFLELQYDQIKSQLAH